MSTTTSTAPTNPIIDLVDSTPLLRDPDALRARAADDGYLYFRGLLPRPDVHDVRRRILGVVADHGWLVEGTEIDDGIADVAAFDRVDPIDAAFCGSGVPLDAYRDVYRIEEFHALGHHPRLLELYEGLLGAPPIRQPLSIARVMVPGTGAAPTPAHQDFIHIQGSTEVWTAWMPMGDCPRDLGGLAVLVGSHDDGLLTYHRATGAGELEAHICATGRPWATTDFTAGDVLTFTSLTVHKSMPNRAGRRVRLSLDMRYQREDVPITEASTEPHCRILGWDEVYRGWQRPELQYYWRDRGLRTVPHDPELRWQTHAIC